MRALSTENQKEVHTPHQILPFHEFWVSLPAKGKAADIKMPPVKRPLSSFILPFPGAALHTRAGLSWWLQCIQDLLYLTNMFQKLKLWVFFREQRI